MDRNNYVGLLLMLILLIAYSFWSSNNAKKLKAEEEIQLREQALKDSIETALNNHQTEELNTVASNADSTTVVQNQVSDTTVQQLPHEEVAEETVVLENDKLRVTLSSIGGRIIQAELLQYESYKSHFDEENEGFEPVTLYTKDHSKFDWQFNGKNSEDLPFSVEKKENAVVFKNSAHNISQTYELTNDNPYLIDYTINLPANDAQLNWHTNFVLQERDMRSDREFTFFAYKTAENKFKKFRKAKENASTIVTEPLDFIVQRQRFFNQTLLGDGLFSDTKLQATFNNDDKENIKLLETETDVDLDDGKAHLQILISPNERDILGSVDKALPNIQPKGIFGLTKALAWLFEKMAPFFKNYGFLIILMTLVIKLVLTPLTYRSYLSQAKMGVLKPEMAELKEKYKDDQAKFSQEQMKLYNKAGVNPLGGCLPTLLQIPIFFSLYYFFRSSIFFRQKEFLWAKDLSTFDAPIQLPFNVPILGDHISLFAVLYGVALFFSMQMNKGMMTGGMPSTPSTGDNKGGGDMQSMMQTQMKFMQYAMPVFLPVIFNSFPAALTFYYFVYNIVNALQTWFIKKFVIDEDKIHKQIQENKAKPKKQSGFRKRIEEAMKAQQEMQEKQKKKK